MPPAKILFLPGAGGSPEFWHPVGRLLQNPAEKHYLGWPGFGSVPVAPNVNGLEDLAALVIEAIDRPVALVAQSMGGVIAVRAALERPELVASLVLTATSGGVDLSALGARDWRLDYLRANPQVPRWFVDDRSDFTTRLPSLRMPVLLIWGSEDQISPVAAGERLRQLLPRAELAVVPGGGHDLAVMHAGEVAGLIDRHLAAAG